MDMTDTVVEQEEKRMEVDVSTITSSPDDDDLPMREDTPEDAFQYDDNPTQVETNIPSYTTVWRIFSIQKML